MNTMEEELSNLRVWYGFAKLTKKIVKKRELVIFFENSCHAPWKKDKSIQQKMHVLYTRFQNMGEAADGKKCNRIFLKYGYFIDEKPFFGDIERVLENNFLADENNVCEEERYKIRNILRQGYYRVYNLPMQPSCDYKTKQFTMIFA
jgi:hypothetical protein